jgi:hypothetical protein
MHHEGGHDHEHGHEQGQHFATSAAARKTRETRKKEPKVKAAIQ